MYNRGVDNGACKSLTADISAKWCEGYCLTLGLPCPKQHCLCTASTHKPSLSPSPVPTSPPSAAPSSLPTISPSSPTSKPTAAASWWELHNIINVCQYQSKWHLCVRLILIGQCQIVFKRSLRSVLICKWRNN
jgi:hypothetical protein